LNITYVLTYSDRLNTILKMKNTFLFTILAILFCVINGCKKSDTVTLPELSTTAVTGVTFTTATSGGIITSDGNASVTARGVCWSATPNPTIIDSKTSDGTGTGQFVSNITGISAGNLYHVRAYATNSAGTAYGDDISFSTSALSIASLSTSAVTSITTTTAITGGSITDDGGSDVTARGVCWSTSTGPTTGGTHTSNGTGKGSFVSNLPGLTGATLYYVRAYATNSTGTAYGNELSFTTHTPQGANDVFIQGMAFSPQTLTVPVNTTVTWTNFDPIAHTVTSDTPLFNSGNLISGAKFSFQFISTGTFTYHCSIHPEMTATIIVQ
jgi:plastocyanin